MVLDLLPRLPESQQVSVRQFLDSKPSAMQLLSLIEELEELPDLSRAKPEADAEAGFHILLDSVLGSAQAAQRAQSLR